jgi:crossover junction endodeoxyribonuclease RuvC
VKRVLALDLSSHTGWATDAPGGGDKPLSGVVDLPMDGEELGRAFNSFRLWFCDAVTVHKPEILAFEAPLMPRGGNFMTSEQTVRFLIGLAAHAEELGHAWQLETYEVNVQTVKKFFAGTGHATKADMVARCNQIGWPVRNHNAADALAVFAFVKSSLDPKFAYRTTPLLGRSA